MPPKKRKPPAKPKPQRNAGVTADPKRNPAIAKLQKQGLTDRQIIDRINGPKDGQRVDRNQLVALGWNDSNIDRFMENQKRRLNPAPPRSPSSPSQPSQPAPTGPGTGESPQDYFDWLEQQQLLIDQERAYQESLDLARKESAFEIFRRALEGWGIPVGSDIEAIVRQAAMEGITDISLVVPDIQNTDTWKNRFPGWHKRVANGYNQVSVAEYLALEDSYHRIMAEAGLPADFYNSPSDFGEWIAADVSPDEVRDRVNIAMNAVRQVDPTARDLLGKFYGVTSGDLAAYFLDQKRALPTLERQYKAVNVAQYAVRAGLQVQDSRRYEDLVDRGVTAEAAAQGYGTVAAFNRTFGRLGDIYGEQFTQADAEEDVFFNNNDKRRRLMQQELASFSGRTAGNAGRRQRGTAY